MFDLQQFLNKLDEMYNNPAGLEDYLADGVKDAEKSQDKGAMLVILNELMGLYRVTSMTSALPAQIKFLNYVKTLVLRVR